MTAQKGELIQEYKTSKAMWAMYGMFIGMMVLFALACIALPFLFPNDKDIVYVGIFAGLLSVPWLPSSILLPKREWINPFTTFTMKGYSTLTTM